MTEAATLFRRSRTMSERCLADIASVSMTDQATASHHQSQGGYYRQYIFECLAQEAEVPYTSVCSMLFGYSRQHAQAVIILGVGAYGTAGMAQAFSAFSELREDTAASATTAMCGLAEELLGLKDSLDVHQATQVLVARAHAATYPLVHLGRDPAAPHRAFAVHADVFFADGINGAVARFQPNAEICALIVVPLEGVTGEAGEVEVVDVLGHHHCLCGDRHLGAPRVQWARAMLAEIHRRRRARRSAIAAAAPTVAQASHSATLGPLGALRQAARRPPRWGGGPWRQRPRCRPRSGRRARPAGGRAGGALKLHLPAALARSTRFAACAAAASPRRPTILVGFEFTGAMRLALELAGRRALSVD